MRWSVPDLAQKLDAAWVIWSVSGPDGTISAFRDLHVHRKVFIHMNNSNPILLDDSAERSEAQAAGWKSPMTVWKSRCMTEVLLTPDELEAELREIGTARYHNLHPFHRMLHDGKLDRGQVQAWALNRFTIKAGYP
jgi:hypothetical protein